MDIIKIALIVKKCKELLNGETWYADPSKGLTINVTNDEGQIIYYIKKVEPHLSRETRPMRARVVIYPDGEPYAEWTARFKDEEDILNFIS